MAIQMNLSKESNKVGIDFPTAYWVIEDITMQTDKGTIFITFSFNAYPNRESRLSTKDNVGLVSEYAWGRPIGIAVSAKLYEHFLVYRANEVFPNGIPIDESEQKDILYTFVKNVLSLQDYVDIFEE